MATPRIVRIGPVPRQEGVQTPDLFTPSEWIDALSLTAGVAETYTLPIDAAGNRGTILRLSSISTSFFYLKWDGIAIAPVVDIINGTASQGVRLSDFPLFVTAPNALYDLSIINANAAIVYIEVWN